MLAKTFREPRRQRNVSQSATLRHSHMTLPFGLLDTELPLVKVHVAPFKRRDFAKPQTRFTAEQHDQFGTSSKFACCSYEPLEIVEVVERTRRLRRLHQSERAWHPLDHVPFDSLLQQHVEHRSRASTATARTRSLQDAGTVLCTTGDGNLQPDGTGEGISNCD